MRQGRVILLFLMGALLACSEDDEVFNTPRWILGYPQVAYGAVFADLNI